MASVFKPVYLRPVPDGAERCKLKGQPAVRYTDGKGRIHVRPIHRDRDGKLTARMRCRQQHWWMRYRLPDGSERREKGFKDRTATEQEGARREILAQQAAAGMQVVREEHLSAPLAVHREAFIDSLKRKGRSFDYYNPTNTRLERIFAACEWQTLRDIDPDDLEAYLAALAEEGPKDTGKALAPKTVNEYLAGARAFIRWCVRARRLAGNPLEGVDPISYESEQDKAALTHEQAERLLAVARNHRLLYLVAMRTGLRRSELKQLQWGDVHLDAIRPHVKLRAATTKAKRADTLPLKADVVQALKDAKPADAGPTDRVFASTPKMWTFRDALDRAGIPHYDEQGKKLCFHSLRVTCGTWLAQAGTPPRVHMELMRHTSMSLTQRYYVDPRLLDTARAVGDLPDLDIRSMADKGQALKTGTDELPVGIDRQEVLRKSTSASVREGPGESTSAQYNTQKPPKNGGFRLRELGLEPRTYGLKGRCSAS